MPALARLTLGLSSLVLVPVLGVAVADSDSCDSSVLQLIQKVASDCLVACPHVCAPLAEIITLYLTDSDPKPVICANEGAFTCVTSRDVCEEMLGQASRLGIEVPKTPAALQSTCEAEGRAERHHDVQQGGVNETNSTDPNATPVVTTTDQASGAPRFAIFMGMWIALFAAAS